MILGVTGGIGCGKSSAVAMFAKAGFRMLDSDRLIREHVLADAEVRGLLRERFGQEVLTAEGAVDRARLGAAVFSDSAALAWLESVTHPRLFALWRKAFAEDPKAAWAVEVPLLFEKGLENWFDFTVCVACSPERQLARLEQRGLPRALAEQRISKQLPLARKIEQADFVLWNDGTPEFLQAEIRQLIEALTVIR
ncbi:MAG: dephospho-CoA kinase [Opitutus sp.]|nr:dephospho-CoA kinase [Opitutus sp.]